MTIAPADFATPLCIAGKREGSVEDEERAREREGGGMEREEEMDKEWRRGEERRKKIEQGRKRSGWGKEEPMQSAERWRRGCR